MTYLPPPPPAGIRLLSDPERARLEEDYPAVPTSYEDCLTCGGDKTFQWWHPEQPDQVADWQCDCPGQWVLHRYLLHCGVGTYYQRLGWRDVRAEQGAVDFVHAYLARADAYVRAGIGMVLHGTKGNGKTLLSSLALKRLIGDGYDARFVTMIELLDAYTAGWRDSERKVSFDGRLKNVRLLVIDDLGKELRGNDLPRATIDEVLRHRIAGGFPTWVTTNKTLDELAGVYGEFVMSLLTEQSVSYHFTGPDYRPEVLGRRADEVGAGLTRPVMLA